MGTKAAEYQQADYLLRIFQYINGDEHETYCKMMWMVLTVYFNDFSSCLHQLQRKYSTVSLSVFDRLSKSLLISYINNKKTKFTVAISARKVGYYWQGEEHYPLPEVAAKKFGNSATAHC